MSLVLAFVTAVTVVTVDDVAVMTWQVTVTLIRHLSVRDRTLLKCNRSTLMTWFVKSQYNQHNITRQSRNLLNESNYRWFRHFALGLAQG